MQKNHLNTNKQFMIGNGILAFAVIFVVVIFVYMSLRLKSDKEGKKIYAEVYHIELVKGFIGDSISIYVNDSLLLDERVKADSIKLSVSRQAEENVLFVVDNVTNESTYFNLSEKGGNILLRKENGKVLQEGEAAVGSLL